MAWSGGGEAQGPCEHWKGGCSYTHGKLGSSDRTWRWAQDLNDKEGLARGRGAMLGAKESWSWFPYPLVLQYLAGQTGQNRSSCRILMQKSVILGSKTKSHFNLSWAFDHSVLPLSLIIDTIFSRLLCSVRDLTSYYNKLLTPHVPQRMFVSAAISFRGLRKKKYSHSWVK